MRSCSAVYVDAEGTIRTRRRSRASTGLCSRRSLDDAPADGVGRHPWDAPHPIVLDTTASLELGYEPAGDYAATVRDELEWLVAAARGGPGSELLPPADDEYFGPLLDYVAEDRRLELRQSE